ncbi:enolase-phosphatase E1 [Coniosporium tulheliwenetii]|uniref:Enolase-phosphatase E1 n=1 Tax=Coniosporium tulheliwenetii TaxID=3383036 RepID=A0ACC2Z2F5_9PEZI|nr:enolase-phosphatase E1 [Cladosporium sp. JES 115]
MDTSQVNTILLDIAFQFPYALESLPTVLYHQWNDSEFQPYRDAFPEEARKSPAAFQRHVEELMAKDVKIAYLKSLQGYLWIKGYQNGDYTAPLFPDVAPQLKAWHAAGKTLAIFSSGSVDAQKLFFQYTGSGEARSATEDLNYLITDYFDTVNAGSKTEGQSYVKIAEKLGRKCGDVLFLSDNVNEVRAALSVGMKAVVVDRPDNAPLSEEDKKELVIIKGLQDI